jgi:hypothetical protein
MLQVGPKKRLRVGFREAVGRLDVGLEYTFRLLQASLSCIKDALSKLQIRYK